MTMYVIGIGGTGSKCIEALTKLAAVGLLGNQRLKVLYIDADETNGNLERSRSSLSNYIRCQQLISGGEQQNWMATPIEIYDLWSPFTGVNASKKLQAFFNYNTLKQENPVLGNMFDVLYTKDEQEVALDVGFRGRPAIGAAVMSQVDLERLDQEPWGQLIKDIKGEVSSGSPPKVFLCGSIFGGTGASGLPTIARLIANKLDREGVKERIKIACLFLLPYFRFSTPPGEDPKGIYARSEQFLLNTEAALRYYVNQAKETFDTVFLLGNQTFSEVDFSVGKNTQRNDPHFLELYAALAARHFDLNTKALTDKVVLISRQAMGRVTWDDIPDHLQVQPALVNGTRFAYIWLAEIAPELDELLKSQNNRQVLSPWLLKFFPTDRRTNRDGLTQLSSPKEQEALKTINSWCQDYLIWWHSLHQDDGEQIQLFNTKASGNPQEKLKREQLNELVYGTNLDSRTKAQDTIQRIKRQLQRSQQDPSAELGIIELAKTLYTLCEA
ncbi:MAG: tubulin-like doman-containing protein [Crocosphaera sp.]|nr:tubulin-like doman-containing protein [Crocosphaera sp.]